MTPQELVANLQAGRAVQGLVPPTVIVQNQQNAGGSFCATTGPTNASAVDSQKVGGQEDCAIQFTAKNPAGEGAIARVLLIGGGAWNPAIGVLPSTRVQLGQTDNAFTGSASVTTNFGDGDVAAGGSLYKFNTLTENGVLTTGLAIQSAVQPKIKLIRLDGQLDECSNTVIKPICNACDDGSEVPTYNYEFCRILDKYNYVEISFPIDADYEITMNTSAYATAPNMVPCAQ
jgi:hypothetical protein